MKKIILFVALATLGIAFNACSSDDSGSTTTGGTVTVKIDGVSTTFDNINVIEKDTTNNEVELHIIASKGNDLSENISFFTYKEAIGTDVTYYFYYNKNDETYYGSNGFSTQITTNNDGTLTGTFSGTMTGGAEEKTLTDGTFNIVY